MKENHLKKSFVPKAQNILSVRPFLLCLSVYKETTSRGHFHSADLLQSSRMNPSNITLRPFRLSDADDLLLWAGDDRVTRSLRWKTLTSEDDVLTFIRAVCIPHPWRRTICIDDRSVGFVSVYPGSGYERCRADIGYALAVEFWGQGITTMAVKIAVPLVFQDFPQVMRLQAFADVENKASQKVLEKGGFTKDGLLGKYSYLKESIKDLVVYSFLSTAALPSVE